MPQKSGNSKRHRSDKAKALAAKSVRSARERHLRNASEHRARQAVNIFIAKLSTAQAEEIRRRSPEVPPDILAASFGAPEAVISRVTAHGTLTAWQHARQARYAARKPKQDK